MALAVQAGVVNAWAVQVGLVEVAGLDAQGPGRQSAPGAVEIEAKGRCGG